MPCYKSSSLPSGFTTTGRTSYKTETDCLNACQEGACCEGTTCSVKPQCQCQCTSGSCCGPDTFTNSNGETGPRCRNESQSACAARGGTWRCGVSCVGLTTDPNAGAPLGSGICTSLASSTPSPVFKGVGTTCSPNPCCSCASIAITVKLASVLGGSEIVRYGCSGSHAIAYTFWQWSCDQNGLKVSLQNLYSVKFDGFCQGVYQDRSRLFESGYIAPGDTGPCATASVGNCKVNFPQVVTLTKQDFTFVSDTKPDPDAFDCWGYGRPETDVLFPQWVKIGPSSNPLP